MKLDKNSHTPLYIQLRDYIRDQIQTGILKPGEFIPTEADLCQNFLLSRYPVRQALSELVEAGYLVRIRGRGTVVSDSLPFQGVVAECKKLGLVLPSLNDELCVDILTGFEKEARKNGFLTSIGASDNQQDTEIMTINRMVEDHTKHIFVFPCDRSNLPNFIRTFKESNVILGLIDRKCNLEDIDYVGSDNFSGGYSATRHLAEQGFSHVIFIRTTIDHSSVNERMTGYHQAVDDLSLSTVPSISSNKEMQHYNKYRESYYVNQLKDDVNHLKSHIPLGIVAANDAIAIYCHQLFKEQGFVIGKDIGIVGFDNITAAQYTSIPLTTIAQNGQLIGQSAAKILIEKANGNTQKHNSIIPTQLIVRQSCGENNQKEGR
ncbi:MAG: GntR family transcriptional regulator [Vallitaleaceae bacterium]|nr:GntR family transcriptional regulator [Vallitaleaceae bacterium]